MGASSTSNAVGADADHADPAAKAADDPASGPSPALSLPQRESPVVLASASEHPSPTHLGDRAHMWVSYA